ncbi:MAG: response regulator transcription factor [Clostridiales bacterium]|jgi:two-component system alkaline phosphatase synthesis response regulator PhoP|nr:response regulator transcription factor [Clostridiales bacterium]
MHTIFSVEDDRDLQDLLRFSLSGFGYDVSLFDTAEAMLAVLETEKPDLFLLDIMLPGMDGIEALKILKGNPRYAAIPVIMLTAKGTEMNIVSGLDAGADDYITKPFSVMELSARINAQLRKTAKPDRIAAEGIEMDMDAREAYIEGRPLQLTAKEFELLYALIKNAGKVQKREALLSGIWGYAYFGETRTLDMHIRTLRAKLNGYADRVVTVRGIGFKYCPQRDAGA